eukprot:TRINITY_DN4697_c3_g3_i1.p1 TRINITY_DN4697_c3_g3~~TRINITY_DN4697_c3_g3_i1.p1  ORF type:complete len:181 (-),score=48.13 TRINITY_DN4697_c3_g3_i1:159-701(-)
MEAAAAGGEVVFVAGDSVLVYDHSHTNLYDGVVLRVKNQQQLQGAAPSSPPQYHIHYVGWDDKWNETVDSSRVLAKTAENEALRVQLRHHNIQLKRQALQEGKDGSVVTMPDILDSELYLEEEARAKIAENWGDENACTYDQGYLDQPIYACKECSTRANKPVHASTHTHTHTHILPRCY